MTHLSILFKKDLTYFLPAKINYTDDAQIIATPLSMKNSGSFPILADSDGFLELPADKDCFKAGEIYNIAGSKNFRIINLVKIISAIKKVDYKKISNFVEDRPFNDQNYKINCNKIKKLGWKEQKNFLKEINKITINNEVFKSKKK